MAGFLTVILGLLWFIQCSFGADMTSFFSINAERYVDAVKTEKVSSLKELLEMSRTEEPLIVLQFDKFDLVNAFDEKHEGTYPFISSLLKSSLDTFLEEKGLPDGQKGYNGARVLKVGEIPASAGEELRHRFKKSDNAVVVEFTKERYDVAELDDYLETLYAFMEDSLKNVDNIVLRVPKSGNSGADIEKIEELREPEKSGEPGDGDDNDDDDSLSSLWTEGLLSCLLVSLLLIAILVVAISWIASLDISYGALEKSANPLKKNN